ncbi:MAG: hypothetical protein M9929_16835, partial [Burkholderiaceae bacterium]|nr:hypothetical protein [Burkholderiaceae bacterium]
REGQSASLSIPPQRRSKHVAFSLAGCKNSAPEGTPCTCRLLHCKPVHALPAEHRPLLRSAMNLFIASAVWLMGEHFLGDAYLKLCEKMPFSMR